MQLKRYTQILVPGGYELALAEYECACGSRTRVQMPDDLRAPTCKACEVAYRRFMARAINPSFKGKHSPCRG